MPRKMIEGKSAVLDITAHKLRTGEGENSYLDVCSPTRKKFTNTKALGNAIDTILKGLLEEAKRMHDIGDQGDLKVSFNLQVAAHNFD